MTRRRLLSLASIACARPLRGQGGCGLPTCTAAPLGGETVLKFDGRTGYVEIPTHPYLSPSTTGGFSFQAWLRPDTLNFPTSEAEGYIHWIGKGQNYGSAGDQEWLGRIYNLNSVRPNRTSAYVFNPAGGLGIGSYVQEPLKAYEWIHLLFTIDGKNTVLYKNGAFRGCDQYQPAGDPRCGAHTDNSGKPLFVLPRYGAAPLRFGTVDRVSFFDGALTRVCIWNRPLTSQEVMELYLHGAAVSAGGGGGGMAIPVTQGLVAAYPLNDIDQGGTTVHDVVGGRHGAIHGGAWWDRA